MRIGITGHTNLTAATARLVAVAIRDALAQHAGTDLVGVTCLARGADQIFAREVLDSGGTLEVVLPAADYRDRKVKPTNAADFDYLLGRADTVHTMPFADSNSQAYMAASEYVLETVDTIIAIWDGQPAAGQGGTADVVEAAHHRAIPTTIIWPQGSARDK
ncbi:hypothetical protein [Actinokineospora sp. NBRC 105648]|uniref:hypothetical protein n=1 Tax=Actinokineospora sp. NBRC 105648 TaxID=3032206 RepID=UPI0024A28A40|nr:hypothetical protein [Actinokineospora sp. NBRC 105648]GLZ39360.1 hypothetical protein Acsp05_29840 [Actinokineospora sp. NBRC 105648]